MVTLKVKVTEECEGLISNLPRFHEYEFDSEEWHEDDESCTVTYLIHDIDELTTAIEQALNTNPEVISYKEQ